MVDIQGMRLLLSQLQPNELGIVGFFLHGGNYTNVVSKWDLSRNLFCPNCDTPNSKYNRVVQCHAYACDDLHTFVDGSCHWPSQRLSSVAACAAVVADMSCKSKGTVHSHLLPGLNNPMTERRCVPFCLHFSCPNSAQSTLTARMLWMRPVYVNSFDRRVPVPAHLS